MNIDQIVAEFLLRERRWVPGAYAERYQSSDNPIKWLTEALYKYTEARASDIVSEREYRRIKAADDEALKKLEGRAVKTK